MKNEKLTGREVIKLFPQRRFGNMEQVSRMGDWWSSKNVEIRNDIFI